MNFLPRLLSKTKFNLKTINFSTKKSEILTSIRFKDGIKTITMCHEKTRNSLSICMMEDLIKNITDDWDNHELRVIVLGAEGPVFSAGHNFKELAKSEGKEQHKKIFKLATELMRAIVNAPVPVVAKVDGIAAAAGLQLMAQCDLAYCTERSQFSTPGVNFGVFCSTPGIALSRLIPKSAVLKMLYTGRLISSQEALNYGLVTKVLPDCNCLHVEITDVCSSILDKSRNVIELGKKFYYQQIELNLLKAYELGEKVMVDNVQSEDGQEGIKCFMEKRKPVFNNKN